MKDGKPMRRNNRFPGLSGIAMVLFLFLLFPCLYAQDAIPALSRPLEPLRIPGETKEMHRGVRLITVHDSLPASFTHSLDNVIEDENRSLSPFFQKLNDMTGPVRIVHIGDSHVRGHLYPLITRRRLEHDFGAEAVYPDVISYRTGGLAHETGEPGIVYHMIGINGATSVTFSDDEKIKEEKQKVIDAGGLKIIGTERHESRRIDNQLRGRSGRQGDPGESRFYIGLDDDLMKIFGGDIVTKVYNTLGADEDMPIESRLISKAVENAQKKVEGRNFSIRKNVLQYDDVMNVQRTVIYEQRRDVLDGMNLKESILKMMDSVVELIVDSHIVDGEEVNKESIAQDIETNLGISDVAALKTEKFDRNALVDELIAKVHEIYASKETEFGEENLRELERVVMLKIVDQKWMDHIDNMDELKKGIGLRGYGQQDPVVQYRLEGTEMFDDMIEDIRMDVVKILLNIRKKEGPIERTETTKVTGASLEDTAINLVDGNISEKEGGMNKTVVNEGPKVGRNDPCPCRFGKKI